MTRYAVVVFVVIALLTTTQGFSWGRVFNNEDNRNRSDEEEGMKKKYKVSQEEHAPMMREESEVAEKPLRVLERAHDDREKVFRAARAEEAHDEGKRTSGYEEEKSVDGHSEERSRRVEAVSVMSGTQSTTSMEQKSDGDAELRTLQKEVSEINRPLGPGNAADKVEVIGVPREREHHITDGLADAIAGLMRVYNSLVRSDGREWDTSVHPSMDNGMTRRNTGNGTVEGKTEESARMGDTGHEKKGGWGPLAVLAGIVIVAGVGVLLVGFTQRERDGPVYPPRGPAYV